MSVTSIHSFAEKVALITDGTNPFGRAVAMQLALNGAYVIVGIPGIDADGAELIDDLSNLGTLVKVCNWRPSDEAGAAAFVNSAASFFGRIDLLVNCLPTQSEQDSRVQIDNSLWATLSVTENAVQVMEERPKPRIVSMVTNEPDTESLANVAISVIEQGTIGMTRALARVLPVKFRVNAVRISTASARGGDGDLDQGAIRPRIRVEPDDVARTVLFLLSGEAVAVNGQVIDL